MMPTKSFLINEYTINSKYLMLEPILIFGGDSEFTRKHVINYYFGPLQYKYEYLNPQMRKYKMYVNKYSNPLKSFNKHLSILDKHTNYTTVGPHYLYVFFVFLDEKAKELMFYHNAWPYHDFKWINFKMLGNNRFQIIYSHCNYNKQHFFDETEQMEINFYKQVCFRIYWDLVNLDSLVLSAVDKHVITSTIEL